MQHPSSYDRRAVLRLGVAALAVPSVTQLVGCAERGDGLPAGPSWLFTEGRESDLGPGSWCWFSSPRTVIDGDLLHAGSVVTGTGTSADGDVVVTSLDLRTHRVTNRLVLGHAPHPDDHANPSVSLPDGPGGRVQVAWAPHSGRPDAGYVFEGTLGRALRPITARFEGTAYAAAATVAGESWVLTRRGQPYSWQLLRKRAAQWHNLGEVTTPEPSTSQARPRPYHLVASSGAALHLFVSSSNPSDFRYSSVYHGTIGADLTIRRTDGTLIGSVGHPPPVTELTEVWNGRRSGGRDGRGWPVAATWSGGRPTVVLSCRDTFGPPSLRVPGAASQLRYVWARPGEDQGWHVRHLCWAGSELYAAQPDYSGLAALDPLDPLRVVVSTNVHPMTGTPLLSAADGRIHWELFEGRGSAYRPWSWVPLTQGSSTDNLRPVIAADGPHRALTWMRGAYPHYSAAVTHLVVRTP